MEDIGGLSMQQKHLGFYREKKSSLSPVQGWTFLENSEHLATNDLYT